MTETMSRRFVARQALAGLVIGFDNIGRAVALATLVFSGTLAAGATAATTIFILTGAVGSVSFLLRRLAATPVFSNVQNTPVAILMPAVIAIAALPASDEQRIATAFAVLATTAVLGGIVLVGMARFDLGRFVRLMPFPVAAGYLAASGALLIVSATTLVCPGTQCVASAISGADPMALVPVGLALALAVYIAAVTRKWPAFGLVGAMVSALAVFYLGLAAVGLPLPEARALGLLPVPMEAGVGPALRFQPAFWSDIRFDALAGAAPLIVAAVLTGLFSTLLNVTGVELALRRDLNTRQELYRAGTINLGTGLFGSPLSFISASNTTAALELGARGQIPVMVAVAGLGVAALFARDILSFVPPFASAGLLVFFGASILWKWLVVARREQSLQEWLLSLGIVAVSLLVGMVVAAALGIVLASMIFAMNYARLPLIRYASSLRLMRSTVDRGPEHSRYLDAHGSEVAVVSLQGFLFFGSIEQLNRHIRRLLEAEQPAHTVILDFSRVSRLDASVFAALRKLDILAASKGAAVILADLNREIGEEIDRTGLLDDTSALALAASTEAALEAAENALLARTGLAEKPETVRSALERVTGEPDLAQRLFDAMAREDVPAGTLLVKQGDSSGDVFMLESGALSVLLTTPAGETIRVRKQQPGSIVGEIAAYAGMRRTANVAADIDSVVYRMTEERLAEIHAREPDLAAYWHRAMASALAEKLDRTNKLLGQRAL